MKARLLTLAVIFAFLPSLTAAPPAVPEPIEVDVGKDKIIEIKFEKPFDWAPGFNIDRCTCVRLYQDPDSKVATFLIRPQEPGEFHVIFWTISEKGYSRLVVTGKGAAKPPETPGTPGTPASGLHFLVIRPNGEETPEFTKTMNFPAWASLVKAGHHYTTKQQSEAVDWYKLPAGTTQTFVVTFRIADGKSIVVREPIPLPTTEVGVLALPNGVK